jgi:hypothetical protein
MKTAPPTFRSIRCRSGSYSEDWPTRIYWSLAKVGSLSSSVTRLGELPRVETASSARGRPLEGHPLDSIDMDSYRVEKQAAVRVLLPDQGAEIGPVPTAGGGHRPEPELDALSNILRTFNDLFGNVHWTDEDRVSKLITEEIPEKVNADPAYQAAKEHSDKPECSRRTRQGARARHRQPHLGRHRALQAFPPTLLPIPTAHRGQERSVTVNASGP